MTTPHNRRSHAKSRRGCQTCKKRRVKCDESGPPCGNCKARATDCDYACDTGVANGSIPNRPMQASHSALSGLSASILQTSTSDVSQVHNVSPGSSLSASRSEAPVAQPQSSSSLLFPAERTTVTSSNCVPSSIKNHLDKFSGRSRSTGTSSTTSRSTKSTNSSTIDPRLSSIAGRNAHHRDEDETPRPRAVFPPTQQLLELQLMHRWTTITAPSISTLICEDCPIWQDRVPVLALQHSFLLHGIFAIAAFEIASSCSCRDTPSDNGTVTSGRPQRNNTPQSDCNSPTPPSCSNCRQYINTALSYQHTAFQSFQAQLLNITAESHRAVLYFSILLTDITLCPSQFASSIDHESPLQTMIMHFELGRGLTAVIKKRTECIVEDDLFRHVLPIYLCPKVPLDDGTKRVLRQLETLNNMRPESSVHTSYCQTALLWLKAHFEVCLQRDYLGYSLAWPAMMSEEYVNAIKERDRVALTILMCWGVLMAEVGRHLWYARAFGRLLTEEIVQILESQAQVDAVLRDVIDWALRQARGNAYQYEYDNEEAISVGDPIAS